MIELYHMYHIFDFTIDYYSSQWALASIDSSNTQSFISKSIEH